MTVVVTVVALVAVMAVVIAVARNTMSSQACWYTHKLWISCSHLAAPRMLLLLLLLLLSLFGYAASPRCTWFCGDSVTTLQTADAISTG